MRLYAERVFPWLVERIMAMPELREQRVPSLAEAREQWRAVGREVTTKSAAAIPFRIRAVGRQSASSGPRSTITP